MFQRHNDNPPELAEDTLEAPQSAPGKPPAHESKIYQPSSFASRKAGVRTPTRRIVSLGPTQFTERDQRTGEVTYREAELFCDIDKPMERWIEVDGVPGRHVLFATSGKETEVTPLPGTVYRRHGRGPHPDTPPAAASPPPRPV